MNRPPPDRLVPGYIKGFEPYIPSKPDDVLKRLYGCSHLFRLNNNENPLGPPPAAQEVIDRFPPPTASVYPSGDSYHLRYKLAEHFGLHPDQFLVGNGANEVITFVIKAFCQEGDNIVTADRTFAVYEWVARFSGFEARLVPLKDFRFDPQGMIQCIDERTKILFLCNPNNPTGSYWNKAFLREFLDSIQGRQIVVVDEAYFEFVGKMEYPNGILLIAEYPNLVVFRTFSKMYGMAGLRIGYLVGSQEVLDIIRRTCVVYSVNSIAQQAAVAALGDEEHVLRTRQMVMEGKAYLEKELELLGLSFVAGEGNFVMIKLPMSDSLAYRQLMTHGVMVRTMTTFRFPNWIRVTISIPQAMEALLVGLRKVIEE
jgi:histidinol-phosphate aminotransferase